MTDHFLLFSVIIPLSTLYSPALKYKTHHFALAETCSYNLQTPHYSRTMTDPILLLSVIIPLSTVYSPATEIQNTTLLCISRNM
jgi:hypothetical protein